MEGDHNPKFKLKKTVELAREIIADAKANPPPMNGPPLDPGSLMSFWNYPIGEALAYVWHMSSWICRKSDEPHSVIGFYHMRTAMQTMNNDNEAQRHFSEAAKHYIESADMFPQDDEKHPCGYAFLFIALLCSRCWIKTFLQLLWRRIGGTGLLFK